MESLDASNVQDCIDKSSWPVHDPRKDVTALAFGQAPTPDARLLVTGGTDWKVHCFLVKYNEGAYNVQPLFKQNSYTHDGPVTCLTLSKDAKLIASASDEGLFKMVDVGESTLTELRDVRFIEGQDEPVTALAFDTSPRQSSLAAGGRNGELHIYELGAWEKLKDVTTSVTTRRSKYGQAQAGKDEETDRRCVFSFVQMDAGGPGGHEAVLALGDKSGRLSIYKPISHEVPIRTCRLPSAISALASSDLHGLLVAASTPQLSEEATGDEATGEEEASRIVCYHTSSGPLVKSARTMRIQPQPPSGDGLRPLALAGRGKSLQLVAVGEDGKLCAVDARSGAKLHTFGEMRLVRGVSVSNDGSMLACLEGTEKPLVWVCDVTQMASNVLQGHGKSVTLTKMKGKVTCVAVAPKGDLVACACEADGMGLTYLFDADGNSVTPLQVQEGVSPRHDGVLPMPHRSSPHLEPNQPHDPEEAAEELKFQRHTHKRIIGIEWSPNGRVLAIGSVDDHCASVTITRIGTGTRRHPEEAGLLHIRHPQAQVLQDHAHDHLATVVHVYEESETALAHLALSSFHERFIRASSARAEILATACTDTVLFHAVSLMQEDRQSHGAAEHETQPGKLKLGGKVLAMAFSPRPLDEWTQLLATAASQGDRVTLRLSAVNESSRQAETLYLFDTAKVGQTLAARPTPHRT